LFRSYLHSGFLGEFDQGAKVGGERVEDLQARGRVEGVAAPEGRLRAPGGFRGAPTRRRRSAVR